MLSHELRRRISRALIAGGITVASVVAPIATATPAAAEEIPPAGSPFFFQTNGPNANLGLGDWYTSDAAGAGSGYSYMVFSIPCGWPTTTPLSVDLFSPEMNTDAGALAQHEEPNGTLDTTTFELYGPGATVGAGFSSPAPGTGTLLTNYSPVATGTPEAWVHFATIDPAVCGSYVVRSETADDDQNGWRIRVGFDNDANVNTAPVDDLDGVPGTNDEVIVGQVAVSYQQNSGANSCIDLYEYVDPGQATMNVHNFDYDGFDIPGSAVNYFSPSGVQISGTISSPTSTWNVSNAVSRGTGDVVVNPESGWWRYSSCMSSGNQFIQEGQLDTTAYSRHPPTPRLTVGNSDGRGGVAPGDTLTYTIPIANPGNATFPGAATAVVATDTLPAGTTFVSCGFVLPATGTCTQSGGVVTATLTGVLLAGATAGLNVTVTLGPTPGGTPTNNVSVAYRDSFANPFVPVAATDVDALATGSIGDFVFLDKNGNNLQDAGDVGLAGIPVALRSPGPDATFGTGDDIVSNTVTSASGAYSFTALQAGTYRVDPDQTATPAGTTLSVGIDPTTVVLTAGQVRTDVDFGYRGTGSIGDTVFDDADSNGVQDAGDAGLAGVPVAVTWAGPNGTFGNGDDVAYSATTNASGVYSVANLPAGNYRVDPTAPAGSTATRPDPLTTTLAAGQNRTDADFGFHTAAPAGGGGGVSTPAPSPVTGSIGDLVWFDGNGNGTRDAGEPGIAGVAVTVTWAGPDNVLGTADDVVHSTTTDAAGAYAVTGLPAGNYRVDPSGPAGLAATTANDPLTTTLAAGQARTDADFGFRGTGSIGDTVFDDLDGNGLQGPGETGIAGVTVVVTWAGPDNVLGTADDVAFSTTTDASGRYSVTNLPAGNYSVNPTAPAGFGVTSGNDPLTTTLAAGQVRTDADFGFRSGEVAAAAVQAPTPTAAAAAALPRTGSRKASLLRLAAFLIVIGGLLLATSRSRHRDRSTA